MHGQLIQWKRNPPTASNMEGSRRSILVELLKQVTNGTSLNDESLQTVFAEAEFIQNPSYQNPYQMFKVQFHCVQCNY